MYILSVFKAKYYPKPFGWNKEKNTCMDNSCVLDGQVNKCRSWSVERPYAQVNGFFSIDISDTLAQLFVLEIL